MKSTASALRTRPVQSLVVGCMTLLPESVVSKLAHLDDERGLRKSTGGLPRSTAPAGDRSPSDGRMDRPPAPSATRARTRGNRLGEHRVRVWHGQDHSDGTATQRLRTKVAMLRGLVTQPELRAINIQARHHGTAQPQIESRCRNQETA